jgi:hypothetical protein
MSIPYCTGKSSGTATDPVLPEVLFCEDCRWYKLKWHTFDKTFSRCLHPNSNRKEDKLISRNHGPYCSIEREHGNCGREGKLWQPR